ncbi:MAG TPA: hypothetical protein PLE74_01915 [Candidatus Cloacimonadota bacterium]|nr:hypothetical protein [Candidatus Cloacimonadota bacterium]HPT71022.1 hypothetical protein [Candidatus Cloacimonadota bacterium]
MGIKVSPKLMTAFGSALATMIMEKIRKAKHDGRAGKGDKTEEQIATIENMLVRLEKKIQENRSLIETVRLRVYIGLSINIVLLLLIFLKLLGIF